MRSYLLFLFLYGLCLAAPAQVPDSALLRLKSAPHLWTSLVSKQADSISDYWIVADNLLKIKSLLNSRHWPATLVREYPDAHLLVIRTTRQVVIDTLLPLPDIRFADKPRIPHEELAISSFDNTLNTINTVHTYYPQWSGDGLAVSVKENKPDTADIDFKGRYKHTSLSSSNVTTHASIMSTLIGGGGNSYYTGEGVAPAVQLYSSNFASLLPDDNNDYLQYGISVQNHSYGTAIENYYGADAAAYDATTQSFPYLLHVFSAGNSGDQASTTGLYAGLTGYSNLTGSFKMGKNMLTVGALSGVKEVEALSSRGPAYDGRLKPELMAFGEDGSSGAAALVSGAALLLQEAYVQKEGSLPSAALVKSILLNSAEDVGTPGIDFASGFGSMNVLQAVQTLVNNQFSMNTVTAGQTATIPLTIPPGIAQVKVTLCWFDPPATANASKALTNDLDLTLINNVTGEEWQPWVLNHFPHKDSLALAAIRKQDTLNNNEQVSLLTPIAGEYTIRVKGQSIRNGPQSFAVSWQLDTAGKFSWYTPVSHGNLVAGEKNIVRWRASLGTGVTGSLSFSADSGQHWTLLNDPIDLSNGFYHWDTPSFQGVGLLRMTAGGRDYLSDTFTVSSGLKIGVGYNCPDSFLLYWNKLTGVTSYRIYALTERYLEPIATIEDTLLVLPKVQWPYLHYTVAPLLSGAKEGMKAYTFNYTTQGVDCYFKSFLANYVNSTTANLEILLGTTRGISSMSIEKKVRSGYASIRTISPVNSLSYSEAAIPLQEGANIYRLKIHLQNGQDIYSQEETVYSLGNKENIVYPNPVRSGGVLHILSTDTQTATFTLLDITGKRILTQRITQAPESIALHTLSAGVYIYQLSKEGKSITTGKLIIW